MAVFYVQVSRFQGQVDDDPGVEEMWTGEDEEFLLEQIRDACRGMDAKVVIRRPDGTAVPR